MEVLLSSVNNNTEVFHAKVKELDNWKIHEVYSEVEDVGQDSISVRWVVSEKVHDGANVVEACLVASWFEEKNTEDLRKDSPTCMKESLRLLAIIVSPERWKIRSLDIKSAFLQGKETQRNICLNPPKEAGCDGKLWELKKTIYGLGDASRKYYKRCWWEQGLK